MPWPRLRLRSPHLNQEAVESEARLPRLFLCVGPGALGEEPRGRGVVPLSVPSREPPAPWARPPGLGDPTTATHLTFTFPFCRPAGVGAGVLFFCLPPDLI